MCTNIEGTVSHLRDDTGLAIANRQGNLPEATLSGVDSSKDIISIR
jgi:hypothetical protein